MCSGSVGSSVWLPAGSEGLHFTHTFPHSFQGLSEPIPRVLNLWVPFSLSGSLSLHTAPLPCKMHETCVADCLISRALAGEEWMDAKHVSNYVLGLRPGPPQPPRLYASSRKRPQASAASPGELGACHSGEVKLFLCVYVGRVGRRKEK